MTNNLKYSTTHFVVRLGQFMSTITQYVAAIIDVTGVYNGLPLITNIS